MRISDWSSDVCSSDLLRTIGVELQVPAPQLGDRPIVRAQRRFRPVQLAFPDVDILHERLIRRLAIALRRGFQPFRGEPTGLASCRERLCQNVSMSAVSESLKKKINTIPIRWSR